MTEHKQFRQLGGASDWWKGAVIYQIYPRSYQDTNGDGVGDLRGIINRLDHIATLGVDAIWISPFFKSPMKDFGYDVSDYRDVDPLFGSLADFEELLNKAHAKGLRILIDLVLSHTSDQHPWFKESRQSADNPKSDWYVWADAKEDGTPPNNWLSIFGGSAWEWETRRRKYYLHNFLTSQPDLNFHHPEVQDALLDMVRFWLDMGVDGFRLDTVNMYVHDKHLRDNPPIGDKWVNGIDPTNPYSRQEPKYNITQPENLLFLERLRKLMNEYPAVTTVGELGAVTDMYGFIAQYTEDGKRIHMAYSFDFMTPEYSAEHIRGVITRMQERGGTGWPCWAFSNHDVPRVVTRWGQGAQSGAMLAALLTSIRGSACLYQGEELALPEANVPFEDLQDPFGIRFWPDYKGRDGCRTPIPWEAQQPYAGFSSAKPWLPIPAEHLPRAVSEQEQQESSDLKKIRTFLNWRKTQPALVQGSLNFVDTPETLVAWVREAQGNKVLCVFNLTAEAQTYTLPANATALTGHGFATVQQGNQVSLGAYQAFFAQLN